MQKWEYKVLKGAGDYIRSDNGEHLDMDAGSREIHVMLEKYGKAGWEMVGLTYKDMNAYYLILKRPKDN